MVTYMCRFRYLACIYLVVIGSADIVVTGATAVLMLQAVENPAREFARKAEEARKAASRKLPLGSIGFGNLQQNVLFGFGEKKIDQAADNVKDVAGDVKGAAQDVAKKVGTAAWLISAPVAQAQHLLISCTC
jgi:hypothetical protein